MDKLLIRGIWFFASFFQDYWMNNVLVATGKWVSFFLLIMNSVEKSNPFPRILKSCIKKTSCETCENDFRQNRHKEVWLATTGTKTGKILWRRSICKLLFNCAADFVNSVEIKFVVNSTWHYFLLPLKLLNRFRVSPGQSVDLSRNVY